MSINVTIYDKTPLGHPEYHLFYREGEWSGEVIAYGEWRDMDPEEIERMKGVIAGRLTDTCG